ncbi:hypothetical protein BS50DRAFT_672860 [Corynespora cassiicola Philippines]|uniref:Uncharacterized protein n=1 Tax=Corynespora cassiicola Philippines TaxID=1448308 RepID=A0A2T2P2X3_CORCC|nr:hypothetical protein BS50DRAFT_672860 [Corynespora cassiicola Philippines]
MFSRTATRSTRTLFSSPAQTLHLRARPLSTLPNNPHIYAHPDPVNPSRHILSLLPTTPPTPSLALGTTTALPPTPNSFTTNPNFLRILSSVLAQHAHADPTARQQAAVFASSHGSPFLSAPSHQQQQQQKNKRRRSDDGSGGASNQSGVGGAGRGGYIHVSDVRAPPDWGRIAEPEDIFGSLEVDGRGEFVGGGHDGEGSGVGNWQDSGTYRVITREGILGLTDFLRGRVVERLRELEKEGRTG